MTIKDAVKLLHDHNIDTMEKDGKVFALDTYTQDGQTITSWKEVKENKNRIIIDGINIMYWLGY